MPRGAGAPRDVTFTDVTKDSGITFSHVWSARQEVHPRVDERRRRPVRLRQGWPARRLPGQRANRRDGRRSPQRAERAVAESGRRHLRRRHRQGRRRLPGMGHGRRRRRLRQRRLGRPVRDLLRPEPPLSQQRRRNVHGRHREGGRRRSAMVDRCGVRATTTAMAGSICSWPTTSTCGSTRCPSSARASSASSTGFRCSAARAGCPARATRSIATRETARSRTSRRRRASPIRSGRFGMGVAWSDFDGDGRPDLFVANDAGPNFLYRNNGDGTFVDVGPAGGDRAQRGRERAGLHGRRHRRLRPLRRLEHLRHELLRRVQRPLPARQRLSVHRCVVCVADGEGQHPARRLGHAFPRLRQRRLARSAGRQRPCLPASGAGGAHGAVRAAQAAVPQQPRTARSRTSRRPRAPRSASHPSAAARRPAISTTTATSTSSSTTSTARRRFCATTAATAATFSWWTSKAAPAIAAPSGAVVTVSAGDLVQRAERRAGDSYLSHSDPRLHFGLGTRTKVDSIEVRWPNGTVQRFGEIPANPFVKIVEGAAGAADHTPRKFARSMT